MVEVVKTLGIAAQVEHCLTQQISDTLRPICLSVWVYNLLIISGSMKNEQFYRTFWKEEEYG